ncbi:MAG: proton-conducting transporter membrane subunit, partial [Thermoplasmata archaeon]
MDLNQAALMATVLTPFVGAAAVLALRNRPNPREAASLVAAILTFLFAVALLPAAFGGAPVTVVLATMFGGLTLQLTADGLGLLFAGLASFLWILTTVYSVGYMRGLREHAQTRYYAAFALVIGATMGVALSANLFSLFLFYEILTVATYPLVVHRETEEAFKAGRKYLVYTLSGGVAILAGLALLYGIGGVDAIAFVGGGNAGIPTLPTDLARVAFLLLMGGFGVKASIVPLHGWLPSAMIAPTPVSGLLHAVAVVKAGVFGLLRVLLFLYGPTLMSTLDLQWIVIAAAVITILVGSLLALVQDDFKLRLAYSTISQLSYIILGAAIIVPIGIGGATAEGMAAAVIGAMFAIAAHAFGKLTMFFVAGAVAVETGKTKISQLDGIGRKMPRTFVAFTLATLSMASLPPMAGFVAKWYLSIGAWNAGDWWILFVLVLSSVLNLAYFLPIVIRAFFRPYEGAMGEARSTLGAPLLVTAAGALVLGLWTAMPYGPFEMARLIASNVVPAFRPGAFASVIVGTAVPPFLIFLIGGPLVLLLKGRARQIGLIILAGIALLDTVFLPTGETWRLPFMGYDLLLLRVDSLSYLTGLIFAIITFFAVLYAAGFAKPWMHLYALLYAGTSMGAVFAGDWVTLLVFWELMAITSTLLIWENGGEAVGAGYRYLLFHGFGGAMLGAGVALLFFGAPPGTTTLLVGSVTGLAALFITIGIGVNVGFIPLHTWLPDSYPKAHFAASLFLSVYTTKAAVYLLARAQPDTMLVAFMGGLMAVYGVTFAVFQTNMRRLLSYHIISQVGYMVAGVGLFGWLASTNPEVADLGLDGGMAHLFNNLLYKTLLFMTIGVIIWRTGENTLNKLGGLQRKMPVTALAFW